MANILPSYDTLMDIMVVTHSVVTFIYVWLIALGQLEKAVRYKEKVRVVLARAVVLAVLSLVGVHGLGMAWEFYAGAYSKPDTECLQQPVPDLARMA